MYNKLVSYLTIFRCKEGGSGLNKKKPYQKNLRWTNKGEGRILVFLLKVEKNKFFMPPPMPLKFLHNRFFTIVAQAFLQVTRAAARSRLPIVQLMTGSSRGMIIMRRLLKVK